MSALTALWLSACGGGGSDSTAQNTGGSQPDTATAGASQDEPETTPTAPAPAPSPAPPPTPEPLPPGTITGSSAQAEPNGSYTVASQTTDTVIITLPRNDALRAGDTVRVSGQSTATWRLAQNAQQYVVTTNLPGNVTPGATWTPREPDAATPDQPWSGTASSASGNRIAAIANPGGVYLSIDGGDSWTRTSLPSAAWTQVQMSAAGDRITVVGDGALYSSADNGQTWSQLGSTTYWLAVHVSDDGQQIVGIAAGGGLRRSVDGGQSFSAVAGTSGMDWRAIAGSADGQRLLTGAMPYGSTAGTQGVYLSEDGGATWTRRLGDGAWQAQGAGPGNWQFAAASADGMRMAVLDNGGYPWVSADGGIQWQQTFGFSGWSGLAVSRQGNVFTAQEPRNDAFGHRGYVFINTTGGTGEWAWSAADLNLTWRGISLSSDGQWMAAADNGLPGSAGGKIYTTRGNRTAGGTLGSITGGQGQSIELTYQGEGRFTVTGFDGPGDFAIR